MFQVVSDNDIHTEIFLEDINAYSKNGDVPKWQIDACLEGFITSKHFHKNLVLCKQDHNFYLSLESRSAELDIRFVFSSSGMTVKMFPADSGRFYSRELGLGGVISYIIDTMYDNGVMTNADWGVVSEIAQRESAKMKKKNESQIIKDLEVIRDGIKSHKYHMHRNTVDFAEAVVHECPLMQVAKVKVIDNGLAVNIICQPVSTSKKRLELQFRSTTMTDYRFYVRYTLYDDNDNIVADKILQGAVSYVARIINTSVGLMRGKKKR